MCGLGKEVLRVIKHEADSQISNGMKNNEQVTYSTSPAHNVSHQSLAACQARVLYKLGLV